jgi:orotidine-5'-phosphate decarboxylase
VQGIVPAVKPQIAFYELYGSAGIACFERTVQYAKAKGLVVVTDGKRNDIGNTATAYAKAHLGKASPLAADFLTVSPFLGEESLAPFIRVCKEENKGIFILVRTSNAGNRMVQDARGPGGDTVSEVLARYISGQAATFLGETGYSSIGAVVGATYPREAAALRKMMKTSLFLVPGYGAQGGGAQDAAPCFHPDGLGAIVNSSRGILYAYAAEYGAGYSKGQYKDSVVKAAKTMQTEIYEALRRSYPEMVY